MDFTQWHMAKKFGYRRDLIQLALSGPWERFWTCRVRGQHLVKMDSHGRCYRCGKAIS